MEQRVAYVVALRYGDKSPKKQQRIVSELIEFAAYLDPINNYIDGLTVNLGGNGLGYLIAALLQVEEIARVTALQWDFDFELREISLRHALASLIHCHVRQQTKNPLADTVSLQNIRYVTQKLGDPIFPPGAEDSVNKYLQVILGSPAAWGFSVDCSEMDILNRITIVDIKKESQVAQLLNKLIP